MSEVPKIAGITVAKYERPAGTEFGKIGRLFGLRAGKLGVGVQMISKNGGESNLHAHPGSDSVSVVLKGKANFYGMKDAFVCEIGPAEGVAIPKGVPYWFENAGEEPLEIYHITSKDPTAQVRETRVNYSAFTENQLAKGKQNGRAASEEEKTAAAAL